jgi:hypothetical protein
MIRQLQRLNLLRSRLPGDVCLAFVGHEQKPDVWASAHIGSRAAAEFPHRPDAAALSEAIPLFYIGRNHNGFWITREAEGRTGGMFLLQRSALHFAKEQNRSAGCATMFLAESIELDVENKGGRFVALLTDVIDAVERRAPLLVAFVRMAVAEWRKLVAQVSLALASERKHRAAIEREIFRGQYTLSSKNDDDLPIP